MARRPRRLLVSKKANVAATRDITQRNEDQSPFLRLPPEIRNRIYHYAMGGKVFHAFKPYGSSFKLKVTLCKIQAQEHDRVDQAFKTNANMTEFRWQHRDCERNVAAIGQNVVSIGISFQILRVCRSIYNEAALVPYAANAFIIDGRYDLGQFCKTLMPAQQRALRDLTFYFPRPSTLPGTLRPGYLTGLRNVRLHVGSFRTPTEYEYQIWAKSLLRFGHGQLTKARVFLYVDTMTHVNKEVLDWATQLEKGLLVSREQREAEKAVQVKRVEEFDDTLAEYADERD